MFTAKNTVISPNFLEWQFRGNVQFPQSFGSVAQNSAETVPFRKISTPKNQVKLRYVIYLSIYLFSLYLKFTCI